MAEVGAEQVAETQARVAGPDGAATAGIATEPGAHGRPARVLLRLVEDRRVDLIVLGARSLASPGCCSGCVHHVVTHAHCSVLVVKEDLHEKG
jgi:nucleotide-binding universal stress UspA family protein